MPAWHARLSLMHVICSVVMVSCLSTISLATTPISRPCSLTRALIPFSRLSSDVISQEYRHSLRASIWKTAQYSNTFNAHRLSHLAAAHHLQDEAEILVRSDAENCLFENTKRPSWLSCTRTVFLYVIMR